MKDIVTFAYADDNILRADGNPYYTRPQNIARAAIAHTMTRIHCIRPIVNWSIFNSTDCVIRNTMLSLIKLLIWSWSAVQSEMCCRH